MSPFLSKIVLAAVGTYAVISSNVDKDREIGIRRSCYSSAAACSRGAAGLAGAAARSRVMKSLLFGIEAVDPLTYATVALGLLIAVAMASYLPARRIKLRDASEALRAKIRGTHPRHRRCTAAGMVKSRSATKRSLSAPGRRLRCDQGGNSHPRPRR